jgi:hypothetical protein
MLKNLVKRIISLHEGETSVHFTPLVITYDVTTS